MNSQEYLEKICKIQNCFLEFLDNDDKNEEKYQNLIEMFDDYEIQKNRFDLKLFLNLLVNISNNHYRTPDFISKIEKIISFFSDEMKNYFSNLEIFNLFKSSKRILLFLIEEKLLTVDKQIATMMTKEEFKKANYPEYFEPEIREFIKDEKPANGMIQNYPYLGMNMVPPLTSYQNY